MCDSFLINLFSSAASGGYNTLVESDLLILTCKVWGKFGQIMSSVTVLPWESLETQVLRGFLSSALLQHTRTYWRSWRTNTDWLVSPVARPPLWLSQLFILFSHFLVTMGFTPVKDPIVETDVFTDELLKTEEYCVDLSLNQEQTQNINNFKGFSSSLWTAKKTLMLISFVNTNLIQI